MHKRRNPGRRLEKPIQVRAASRIRCVLTSMPPLRVRSALARNRRCTTHTDILSDVAGRILRNGRADGRIRRGTLKATLVTNSPECFCVEAGCQRFSTTSSEVNVASDLHENQVEECVSVS